MDGERMSFSPFDHLAAWAMLLSICAHFAAGIMLGLLYFRTLWWNVHRFALGDRTTMIVALMIGRFVLLGCLLTLASLEGALPLLMIALGTLIARFTVMRRIGVAAP
jgi:F1F0 ATPase subunit 2